MDTIVGTRRYREKALLALAVVAAIGAAIAIAGSATQRAAGAAVLIAELAILAAGRRTLRQPKG